LTSTGLKSTAFHTWDLRPENRCLSQPSRLRSASFAPNAAGTRHANSHQHALLACHDRARTAPRYMDVNMRRVWPLMIVTAFLVAGCSNQAIVLGNIASMVVAVGLFYSTIKLGRD